MSLRERKFREEHLERHAIFKKYILNCALHSIFIGILINFDTRNAHKSLLSNSNFVNISAM